MRELTKAGPTIKVLIADDHPMMREGIRALLEREPDIEVVGEAADGEMVVTMADVLQPDVILMDVGMPGVNGLEATRRIKEKHGQIAVLVLTVHDDDEYIMGLLEAGAAGYLLKCAYGEELVQAIRSVRTGEFVLSAPVGQRLLKRAMDRQPRLVTTDNVEQLTPRELQVLKLAASGLTNRDIAKELGIGVRTVKGHLLNIFGKMRVGSRTEAVLRALKQGWIILEQTL